jgi:hypothetical protein
LKETIRSTRIREEDAQGTAAGRAGKEHAPAASRARAARRRSPTSAGSTGPTSAASSGRSATCRSTTSRGSPGGSRSRRGGCCEMGDPGLSRRSACGQASFHWGISNCRGDYPPWSRGRQSSPHSPPDCSRSNFFLLTHVLAILRERGTPILILRRGPSWRVKMIANNFRKGLFAV